MATAKNLRILIVEDIPADAELIEQTLRQAGLVFSAQRVETRNAFVRALEGFDPDIVLSDCRLPGFDGFAVIGCAREKSASLPVILVTGVLGDQAAVELVKAGANDYILKDGLARLPAALQRALAEAQAIRARRRAEEALRLSEERYRSLVVAIAQIVWTTNADGQVTEDQPAWRGFTGQPPEAIKGDGWLAALHPSDRERVVAAWSAAVRTQMVFEAEYRLRRHDAEYRYFSVRGVPVKEKDGTIREWIGVCTDITERKRHEEELAEVQTRMMEVLRAQAVRDPLTGLFNRQYLDETLLREFRSARRRKAPFSLAMLDIDHFKIFNDTYGHAAGDEVLKELGKVLRDAMRASDIACRYGERNSSWSCSMRIWRWLCPPSSASASRSSASSASTEVRRCPVLRSRPGSPSTRCTRRRRTSCSGRPMRPCMRPRGPVGIASRFPRRIPSARWRRCRRDHVKAGMAGRRHAVCAHRAAVRPLLM